MIPSRGILLVRPIETSETLPGGRILLTSDHRAALTAQQCEVVAVGAFAVCDPRRSKAERNCTRQHTLDYDNELRLHHHPIRVGDWLLVAPRSTIAGPDPEDSARFVHQDAVWAIFTETQP